MIGDNKINIKEEFQEIKNDLYFNLEQTPKRIKKFYTNNVLTKSISLIGGMTARGVGRLFEVTESGALKVANIGSGLEKVTTKIGTTAGTVSDPIEFLEPQNRLRIIALDYDFYIATSPDGHTWNDPMYVFAKKPLEIDIVTKAFTVQSAEANDAEYRIEGLK